MRPLAFVLALGACGAPAALPPAAPSAVRAVPDLAARIAAECALLEAAQAATAVTGRTPWPDVLAGCPGHARLRPVMTLPQMSAATRAANAAALPDSARGLGPRADLVFRRMITRGVPPDVARALVSHPAFAAAVR